MNPAGRDSGKEWVELYNPTSYDINIGNFAIQAQVRPLTITIPAGTVIGAGQFNVIKVQGEKFSNIFSERLKLFDSSGKALDSTPPLLDRRDDGRTWQRVPGGSSTWRFTSETQGESNDPATYQSEKKVSETTSNSGTSTQTAPHFLGTALCLEGKVRTMVDTDTLYVESSGKTYRVDLSSQR